MDVLVVGTGPGGSAAAALLARAGCRVTAVDRAVFPRDKACSEYMGPETVRLLDRFGVVVALEAAGAAPLHGTAVTGARGSRLHGRFALAGPPPFRPTGLSVARRTLDDLLVGAARAAGATVLERTAVEELVYDRGAVAGAVVRDAGGERRVLRARLTIGADGLRSVVARRIGRRRHGRPRRIAFVAHVDGVAGMGDSAEMHVGLQGYVGLNPIGGGRTNVALVVPAARGPDARGRVEAFFLEALERFPGLAERVGGGALARKVLATGPFAAWSGRVTVDGAALVGDAADFFDPFTGEGIYSALRGSGSAGGRRGRGAGAAGPGRRGPAGRLPVRPAAGLRGQVGGRTAHRLRDAVPRAVRPRRRPPGTPGRDGRHADRRHRRLRARAPGAQPALPHEDDSLTPTAIDPARFRQLLGRFATGVTILTTRDPQGRPAGMTASSLASVSLQPPLVSVCVDHAAALHDLIVAASEFVVNILESGQEELSRRFADHHEDRFAGIGYHAGPEGQILLDGALAHIECERFAMYPGGDHTIIVGRVIGGDTHDGHPLLYFRGGYTALS